jgi:chaperone modulatory protein CbpM
MSWTIEQAAAEIGIERRVIGAWVEQRWVLPAEKDGDYLFEEVDLARLKLIKDLVGELEVGEEAMPILLNLLDQLYEARRALAELETAIAACTEEVRDEIAARLARRD